MYWLQIIRYKSNKKLADATYFQNKKPPQTIVFLVLGWFFVLERL